MRTTPLQDAIVRVLRAVPCIQVRPSARFAEPTHALERRPAQTALRVDLGTLSPAENVASVRLQTIAASRGSQGVLGGSGASPDAASGGGNGGSSGGNGGDGGGGDGATRAPT